MCSSDCGFVTKFCIRYSVNDITQQVQELEKSFEQFQNKMKQITGDFKQQAENIITVCQLLSLCCYYKN